MPSSQGNDTPSWDAPTQPGRYPPPTPAIPPLSPPPLAPGTTPLPMNLRPYSGPYPDASPSYYPAGAPTPARRHILRNILLVALAEAVILVLCALLVHRLYDFGTAISPQGPLSSQTSYIAMLRGSTCWSSATAADPPRRQPHRQYDGDEPRPRRPRHHDDLRPTRPLGAGAPRLRPVREDQCRL